ncbi:SGNH/GDSL hydrolase family protein [Microcoleus sp. herbarium12]|uniref:SGNH/GDSL hydrolase family protein n=1 Tax=Microcoleus sp. herbarium12 TaxID=3055437 RepID=UPI002FD602AC
MRDREILLIVTSVILTLIFSNLSLFLKSFSSTPLASPEIKQAARQIEIDGFRKSEQDFWSKIKDVNFDSRRKTKTSPVKTATKPAVAAAKPAKKPTPAKPKLTVPYRKFLFIGDSVMFDLGTQLQYTLKEKYNIANTKIDYKVSSGLNRIDYYDWYARTSEIIQDYRPDVVIVLFGGNDTQDITDSQGKYRAILSLEWQKAYQERVEKYAKLLGASSVKKVYWIGQSISNKSSYIKAFPIMNNIYKNTSKYSTKIEFISTWDTFAEAGNFVPIVANKSGKRGYVKINDGLHFTSHGAEIISDAIVDKMAKDKILKAPKKKP